MRLFSGFFSLVLEESVFGQCPPMLDPGCGLATLLLVPLPTAELGVFPLGSLLRTKGNILEPATSHRQKWHRHFRKTSWAPKRRGSFWKIDLRLCKVTWVLFF